MRRMFYFCENFESDLSRWNTSKVENMNGMFMFCRKLKCDLSDWDVSKVKDNEDIFVGCRQMYDNPQLQPKFI